MSEPNKPRQADRPEHDGDKDHTLPLAGIGVSILYLIFVIGLPFTVPCRPGDGSAWRCMSSFNEWGDYLAGMVAPLALGWFVATLWLQRTELALQRKELRATREANQDQAEQQAKTAEHLKQANELQQRAISRENALMLEAQIANYLPGLLRHIPARHPRDQGRALRGDDMQYSIEKMKAIALALKEEDLRVTDLEPEAPAAFGQLHLLYNRWLMQIGTAAPEYTVPFSNSQEIEVARQFDEFYRGLKWSPEGSSGGEN